MRWLFRNLSALLLSLALAVTIWVVAVNEEDPFEERQFPEAVPVVIQNLPDGMMIVSTQRPTVNVQIRAPHSVWATLTLSQIHVTADLSQATSGDLTVPLNTVIDQRDARLISLSPSSIDLSLEQLVTRDVPVRLDVSGDPATGYEEETPGMSETSVSLSGPASAADAVSEVVARVDITGTKQSVVKVVDLLPLNATGQVVAGVDLAPKSITVTIPITQLGGYREVAVKAVIDGQVAQGFRITNITVSPPVVTLFSSNPSLVAGLPGFVETEPISIANANNDLEVRVTPKLPEGVSLPGAQTVLVQISVAAIENSITIQRDLEIEGLGTGLGATASPSTVDVILAGPLPTLDSLTPQSVRVVLNLLNQPIGLHQIKPEVIVLPEGVTVQTVLPETIEVLVAEAGSITPLPSLTPTATLTLTPTRRPFTRTPTASATANLTLTSTLDLSLTPTLGPTETVGPTATP